MDWIIDIIKQGYVDVVNPFNLNQISRVSLDPEIVKCWVWWSKNFEDWITNYQEKEEIFRSYSGHYFQFTINSPSELENNLKISLDDRFNQLEWLIKTFGHLAVNYRFDPIVLYKKEKSSKIESNLDKFEYIIERVSSLGIKEVIFSFATIYSKVLNRMKARRKVPIELSFKKKKEITLKLIKICEKNNIQLKACCQPDLLKIKGIDQAHCIDVYKIEKIIQENLPKIKDTGQRKECGCFKSKDIGGYTGIFRCKHNCDYCYASPSQR
jgi:hypothetical protein